MASPKRKQVDGRAGASAKLGSALHDIRTEKGLTLSEVSLRTGLPVSTLSKIENDKMSLTYDKLARISTGLEIDIAQLFSPAVLAGPPGSTYGGRRSVTRAGEGQRIETDNYTYIYPAADLLKKRYIPMVGELHARSIAEFGEMIRHAGEEYTYVLEGIVEVHTDLYAPVTLNQGDSIYFDSGMGHAYIAAAPGPCRILAISSGPESQVIETALKTNRTSASSELRTDEPDPQAPAGRPRGGKS